MNYALNKYPVTDDQRVEIAKALAVRNKTRLKGLLDDQVITSVSNANGCDHFYCIYCNDRVEVGIDPGQSMRRMFVHKHNPNCLGH